MDTLKVDLWAALRVELTAGKSVWLKAAEWIDSRVETMAMMRVGTMEALKVERWAVHLVLLRVDKKVGVLVMLKAELLVMMLAVHSVSLRDGWMVASKVLQMVV